MAVDDQKAQFDAMPVAERQAVPFGTYGLSSAREAVRSFGNDLPINWIGRKLNSALRYVSVFGKDSPYDIEVFPAEYARLYPTSNRCEKRALCGTQFWDLEERTFLETKIRETKQSNPFVFVDAGANIGLYSLFARSVARQCGVSDFQLVCIEPDPVNSSRLAFNMAQSAYGKLDICRVALGSTAGFSALTAAGKNRGEIHIDESPEIKKRTPMISLSALADELTLQRVDVLKIDVEGYEEKVLRPFFEQAVKSLWPRGIIIETEIAGEPSPAILTCFEAGYELVSWTHINVILALPDAAAGFAN